MTINYFTKCGARSLFTALDETRLLEFEKAINTLLPNDYREFLLEWNGVEFVIEAGAVVAYPTQSICDHSERTPLWSDWMPGTVRWPQDGIDTVETLYGLSDGGQADREAYLARTRGFHEAWQASLERHIQNHFDLSLPKAWAAYYHEWIPERFLPIGSESYGRVCISLAEPDRGQVFHWSTPIWTDEETEKGPNMGLMSWIAPSFSDFWESIRIMSQDEYDLWQGGGWKMVE